MIKKKKTIYLSTLLFLLSASTNLCVSCTNKRGIDDEQEETLENKQKGSLEYYGVYLVIKCDLSSYSKYNEWVSAFPESEEYLLYENNGYNEKYDHYLNIYLSKCFLNEIINNFPNADKEGSYIPSENNQILLIIYSINKSPNETTEEITQKVNDFYDSFFLLPDYEYINNLSNEPYIVDFYHTKVVLNIQDE